MNMIAVMTSDAAAFIAEESNWQTVSILSEFHELMSNIINDHKVTER